jgi:hypothetical protein
MVAAQFAEEAPYRSWPHASNLKLARDGGKTEIHGGIDREIAGIN